MILPKEDISVIIRTAQVADAQAIACVRVVAWRAAYRGLMPDTYLQRADLEAMETEQLRNRLGAMGERARQGLKRLCAESEAEEPLATHPA